MKKETCFVAIVAFMAGAVASLVATRDRVVPVGGRERVELITWRTQNPHAECPSNGFWQVSGQPRKIEAYGIDKNVWPHRCTGCGATNEIYDATWPKFEREWRPLK